jgi:hypothetical protein
LEKTTQMTSTDAAPQTRNRTRLWATLTAVAGVVALGVVFAFRILPEVKEAGACAANDAVLRFELARTPADLEAIFGPAGGDCRAKVVAAMDAINTLDVAVFIPAYTAFVALAALFLTGGALHPAAVAAIAAAAIALGADYIETFALLSYTPDLNATPAMLAQSSTAAWIKFAALGLNALALAALCFTPRKRWILGSLLCLPAIGVAMMFIDLRWIQAQTLGFLAGWTALLIMAVKSAITGRT